MWHAECFVKDQKCTSAFCDKSISYSMANDLGTLIKKIESVQAVYFEWKFTKIKIIKKNTIEMVEFKKYFANIESIKNLLSYY